MTKLQISPDLALPDEAASRSFGILGMRGSGKSNAAVVLAEEMFRVGIQWVAIDPKGDWWGIRSSKDGKGPGLPVVIFGGEHADVPLEPTSKAGVLVADLILNEAVTCVLDLGEFSKAQKIQFLAGTGSNEGFAERLFRKKKRDQDPIHMFLEEAHDYVPQQAKGDVGKMVEVVSRLQTMGRNRGLGCSILSQRSARVHKDVLTQVDVLVAFRTIGPQDRAAILAWVKDHGLSQELVASLPELKDGEAWVWSPEWLGELVRIRFNRRSTYDSGATPTRGAQRRRPATLADVDLGAITHAMAATIERAKAEDPRELRRRIADLERQLKSRAAETKTETVVEQVEIPVEIPVITEEGLNRLHTVLVPALEGNIRALEDVRMILEKLEAKAEARVIPGRARNRPQVRSSPAPRPQAPQQAQRPPAARTAAPRPLPATADSDFRLGAGHQKILNSLAWWEAIGFEHANRVQVGFIAGYNPGKRGGGHFGNLLGNLRTAGLIDYPASGAIALTDAGRALAEVPAIPATDEAFQEVVLSKLAEGHGRILRVLIEAYPVPLPKPELAERAGYAATERGGGHFGNLLGNLRSFGLIEYPGPGLVAALPVLFLEDAR